MLVVKGPRSCGVYHDSTQLRKVDVYDIGNAMLICTQQLEYLVLPYLLSLLLPFCGRVAIAMLPSRTPHVLLLVLSFGKCVVQCRRK